MVHLVGFTIKIYYDARHCERQIYLFCFMSRNSPQQFILQQHQFRDTEETLLILFIVSINERSCIWKSLRIILHHTENHTSVLEFCINFTIMKSNQEKFSEIAQHISSDNTRRQIQYKECKV